VTDAVEEPPAGAAEVFAGHFDLAVRYAKILRTAGVERGLIGPRESDRIWRRHLLNSAALALELPARPVDVVDVGSGAGLPGIPVWLVRPDIRLRLVESMQRRVGFLRELVAALDVPVEVVHARAESLPPAATEVIIARAVAPLSRLIPLAVRLLRPGGVLLALKGATADADIADAAPVWQGRPELRLQRREVSIAGETAVVVRVDLLPRSRRS
jgi:16S rRNA (guanine527-N7)-methyltransferase